MKKSIKILSLFIIALVAMFVSKETVFAGDNSPSRFNASTYEMTNKPLGLTQTINIKKTTDGRYVYCLDVNKKLPTTSIRYSKNTQVTDPAIRYIIASGANDVTDTDFFVTQSALWIYLLDTNQMKDNEYGYIQNIKNAVYNSVYSTNSVAVQIKNLLNEARNATQTSNVKPTLEIKTENVYFNLNSDGLYVSNTIEVNTTGVNGNYEVILQNQPEGSGVRKVSNGFVIYVPEEKMEAGSVRMSATVQYNTSLYNVYKYTPSSSSYQPMLAVYSEDINLNDNIFMTIAKPEDREPTTILISKQDIDNKGVELPGAVLRVTDQYGKVVARMISTNEPTTLDSLTVGTYTLEEESAPAGYQLSYEKITFEVKKDGQVRKVVMYNSTETKTTISISKRDITTNQELPGATLVLRNSYGRELYRWVSNYEPYVISGLEVGTYTIEEIYAPEGYKYLNATTTFKVNYDGEYEEVVIYNYPEDESIVSVSKQDIITKQELPGATLVIKNIYGQELYRWVSGYEPYIIKGLEKGTYTLEEIYAPSGYQLNTERLTFNVSENGVVTEVVMFNTPEATTIIVPPTGTSASTLLYIFGGLVLIIGSVLIYKNVKKEQ